MCCLSFVVCRLFDVVASCVLVAIDLLLHIVVGCCLLLMSLCLLVVCCSSLLVLGV